MEDLDFRDGARSEFECVLLEETTFYFGLKTRSSCWVALILELFQFLGCVFGAMVYSYSGREIKIVTFFPVKGLEQKICRWTTMKVSEYILWRILNSNRPLSAEFVFLEESTFCSGLKPQTPCWLLILELLQFICNIWSNGSFTFSLKFVNFYPVKWLV